MQKKTFPKKNLIIDDPANFFILYANLSLKNPENLKVIFEIISQFERKYLREIEAIDEPPSSLKDQVVLGNCDLDVHPARIQPMEMHLIIEEIINLIEKGERQALEINIYLNTGVGSSSFVNKFQHRLANTRPYHNTAFEAVYSYLDNGCDECAFNIEQERKFHFINHYINGKDFLSGKNRVNCIECEQLAFLVMLKAITDNRNYSDSFGFGEYLAARNGSTRAVVTRGFKPIDTFRPPQNETTFEKKEVFDPSTTYYKDRSTATVSKDFRYIFADYLRSLMGFSLINYLTNKKSGDIYMCQYEACSNFYLSKKRDKKNKYCSKCSPINKRSKEDQKKYDSNRYLIKKKEKEKKMGKARIESIQKKKFREQIKKGTFTEEIFTKEEIIELWQKDKNDHI